MFVWLSSAWQNVFNWLYNSLVIESLSNEDGNVNENATKQ